MGRECREEKGPLMSHKIIGATLVGGSQEVVFKGPVSMKEGRAFCNLSSTGKTVGHYKASLVGQMANSATN